MNFLDERIDSLLAKAHDIVKNPPWIMFQAWRTLLFASWEIDPAALRPLVPEPLEIDTFGGKAFVTLVPMYMVDVHLRGLPAVPFENTFPEINLRTYVRSGKHTGVHFFSIDATPMIASLVARVAMNFPYIVSSMKREVSDGWIHLQSERKEARLDVRYRGVGDEFLPAPGSVEEFLLDRLNALFVKGDHVHVASLQHSGWHLQRAEAEFKELTIPQAAGLPIVGNPTHMLYSAGTDTIAWPISEASGGAQAPAPTP